MGERSLAPNQVSPTRRLAIDALPLLGVTEAAEGIDIADVSHVEGVALTLQPLKVGDPVAGD